MEIVYLAFILASAFSHSFYNFLMHKSGGNRLFLLLLFTIASLCASINYLISEDSISLDLKTFLIIYGASIFYVLYQISVTKAYEKGEISKLYPLTVLSPIFVPIWAFFFLKETLNLGIIIGILVTIIGAISVKQKSLRLKEFKTLFSVKGNAAGAGFAILASLMYSIGSVLDKSKIGDFNLIPYLAVLLGCMAFNMLLFSLFFERKTFKDLKKIKWFSVIVAGITGYISFYTFRAALQHVDVSLAVPVRLSSIFFALLLGILFLNEKLTLNKVVGISIIIGGILIINLSSS